MIELDVHCLSPSNSLDEDWTNLCVIHDETLDRTTNASGTVAQLGAQDLAHIDAGDGESIPHLTQVFDLASHQAKTIAINIELKGLGTATPVAHYLEHLSKQPSDIPVLVSSFNHTLLSEFRSLDPHTAVAPLYNRGVEKFHRTAKQLDAFAVNISAKSANEKRIRSIRSQGYRVFVYTVNSLEIAMQLRSWGASGVFTDHPDRLLSLQS